MAFTCTVEPLYNEVLGTMKMTLLYQVSRYIRVKKQRNIKIWEQQNYLVIRGFCYIRPLYNEVPLYIPLFLSSLTFSACKWDPLPLKGKFSSGREGALASKFNYDFK